MANTQVRIRSPKGNVGVSDVVDAGELSAYSQGALSGFGATSAASFTIQIGGSSSVQDVAVGKNPAGESELFVGTSGTTIPFIIGGAPGTPGQSRTDALVLYKDPFTTSVVNNGLDVTDYAVVAGTPATTGTQVPPSMATIRSTIPTGSLKFVAVIGYVTIAQGAGSITTGNFVINRSQLSGLLSVPRQLELKNGTGGPTVLTASYVDQLTTSTLRTNGGLIDIEGKVYAYNAGSGADRYMDVQLLCDGAVIATHALISIPLNTTANAYCFYGFNFQHTPAAGTHVYKIQARGSTASSVAFGNVLSSLKVTEIS